MVRRKGIRPADCHPEKRNFGGGLCQRCYNKIYRKAHNYGVAGTIRRRYGINMEQWNAIFEIQKGLCPVCLKQLYKYKDPSGRKAANVDHDHRTKRVRGLLCWFCNRTKVGNITLDEAKRVVTYLESNFDGRNI